MTFALFLPWTTSKTNAQHAHRVTCILQFGGGQCWTMPHNTASEGNVTSCCKLDLPSLILHTQKHKGAAFHSQFLKPKFCLLCPFNYVPNNKQLTLQVDTLFWQCLAMPNTASGRPQLLFSFIYIFGILCQGAQHQGAQ